MRARGTRNLAWIRAVGRQFGVEATERADLAILAIQGPEARVKSAALLSASAAAAAMALGPFYGRELDGWFVARTVIRERMVSKSCCPPPLQSAPGAS